MGLFDALRRQGTAEGAGGGERWAILGIGNPGNEYAGHRHNVGFWAINRLAREFGVDFNHSKLASKVEVDFEGRRVMLVKPRTYVNESGRAVAELMRNGLKVPHLIVIYDDLDMPPGQIRVRGSGGHGGHNGMRSIIAQTGSGDFARIRVGIGRPTVQGVPTWDPQIVIGWVLGNPPPAQREELEAGAQKAAEAALAIIRDGAERTMNAVNAKRKSAGAG